MDNSISKALIMVASVLLAMIVIAFLTYTFNRTGMWATTQDEQKLAEQREQFNKEYEAYDKDLMYGVDVISCLNKALSNNDKITEVGHVNGEKVDTIYDVKVKVKLKDNTPLEESITVYYMQNNKELEYEDNGPSGKQLKDADFSFIKPGTQYLEISNFEEKTYLKTQSSKCKKLATEMELTKDKNGTGEDDLRALLSLTNTLSEIKKNKNKTEAAKGKGEGWTKAEFRSALYDLKTRRFTCSKIEYSADTGRVNYIEFNEI